MDLTKLPRDFCAQKSFLEDKRSSVGKAHVVGCTGYDEDVLMAIFRKYGGGILGQLDDDLSKKLRMDPDLFLMLFVHVFMFIHFAPTEFQMPLLFGYSSSYFNKNTRHLLKAVGEVINEIDFNDRLDPMNHPADVPWMWDFHMGTADTFPIFARCPSDPVRRGFLIQPKYKAPVWKCHLVRNFLGIIIHFHALCCGSTSDKSIWRKVRRDMRSQGMRDRELYVCDGIYHGERNTTAKRPRTADRPYTQGELEKHMDLNHVRLQIEHGVSLFNGSHNLFHMAARCDDETLFYCARLTAHATNVLIKYRIEQNGPAYDIVGPWPHNI